jgi:hydrogenase maturation protease
MTAITPEIRVLCLGNELLADDALGLVAAEELRRRFPHLDVVFTTDSGFHLLDYLSDYTLLVVVDSIQTGQVPGGTVLIFPKANIQAPPGPSPHYVGLFETLQLGRKLVLPVPEEVIILAVEAVDCLTLGGEMDPAVKSAVGLVAELVGEIVQCTRAATAEPAVALADCWHRAFETVSARYAPGRVVVA